MSHRALNIFKGPAAGSPAPPRTFDGKVYDATCFLVGVPVCCIIAGGLAGGLAAFPFGIIWTGSWMMGKGGDGAGGIIRTIAGFGMIAGTTLISGNFTIESFGGGVGIIFGLYGLAIITLAIYTMSNGS